MVSLKCSLVTGLVCRYKGSEINIIQLGLLIVKHIKTHHPTYSEQQLKDEAAVEDIKHKIGALVREQEANRPVKYR